MRWRFILFANVISLSLGAAFANEFEAFHSANQAFDKGEFEVAAHTYESLIDSGLESGELHFNLGNAYFRAGKKGQSIFHYRRALELLPRDADIKFNLAYARDKVVDKVEDREPFWSRLGSLIEGVSEKEAWYLLSGFALTLLGCGLFALFRPYAWLTQARTALALCVSLLMVVAGYHTLLRSRFGVVTVPEAKVYSGVGADNVVLFALHEGVEFTVAEELDGDWVRIRLGDGKQGWVKIRDIVYEKNT